MDNDTYRIHRKELVDVIRYLSQKGWVPATSSNFSTKIDAHHISISRSGVDKSEFMEDDLIVIDFEGEVLFPKGERSSAETLIHTAIYNHFENIDCVLHTHSVNGTLLSRLISNRNEYIEKDQLISLRGTLVPATTINKAIGSIPILGKILVGSKTGEGVFGVSFKIKGPPKDLETTVNPIKTLTPRFITRTLEKIKKN